MGGCAAMLVHIDKNIRYARKGPTFTVIARCCSVLGINSICSVRGLLKLPIAILFL